MGNYKNIETEFIERTLNLISQYESKLYEYDFENQYNHTLLVNCLLGLIVFPKEKTISFLPNCRILSEIKEQMGLNSSEINMEITNLKDLIIEMRHSIAHFNISFQSNNEEFLIDRIEFRDQEKGPNYVIASFAPNELLNFVRYYAGWLIHNIRNYMEN